MSGAVTSGASGRSRRGFLSRTGRKLVLTVHVVASVGWLGQSFCLLALSLTGMFTRDPEVRQGSYRALSTIAGTVAPPLAIGALATGILISVGSHWGLFRHKWVVISLVLTTILTVAVLVGLGPLMGRAAELAQRVPPGETALQVDDVRTFVAALVAPCVAIVLLSMVTALNVFKPRLGKKVS